MAVPLHTFCAVVPAADVSVTVAATIVKLVPLSLPVTDGPLLITLILYPNPAPVPAGMVALIVSLFKLLTNVPIETGLPNEPAAFDNCAV